MLAAIIIVPPRRVLREIGSLRMSMPAAMLKNVER